MEVIRTDGIYRIVSSFKRCSIGRKRNVNKNEKDLEEVSIMRRFIRTTVFILAIALSMSGLILTRANAEEVCFCIGPRSNGYNATSTRPNGTCASSQTGPVCVNIEGPPGPQGPLGPMGPQGPSGFACWDLNSNNTCDLATEDLNNDNSCTVADCTGPQGPEGPQGEKGDTGDPGMDGASAADLCAQGEVLLGGGDPENCVDLAEFIQNATTSRLVFVTNATYTGDLVSEAQAAFTGCSGVTTGLDAADCICQETADDASLFRTFQAWLSDDTGSPSTRFFQSPGPYVMLNGIKVADNWADLTDGDIDSRIHIDETGTSVNPTDVGGILVWSNTLAVGATIINPGEDCDSWTDGSTEIGRFGSTGDLTNSEFWTNRNRSPCSTPFRLYCFEQ